MRRDREQFFHLRQQVRPVHPRVIADLARHSRPSVLHRSLRPMVAAMLITLVLLGATPVLLRTASMPARDRPLTQPPAGQPATTTADPDPVVVSIQATMDAWSAAIARGDRDALRALIAPQDYRLRSAAERWIRLRSDATGVPGWRADVRTIIRRPAEYVQAEVALGDRVYSFILKRIDGQWRFATPRQADFGREVSHLTHRFEIRYRPWDADVVPTIAEQLEAIDQRLRTRLGAGPATRSQVQIIPSVSLLPDLRRRNAAGGPVRVEMYDTFYHPQRKTLLILSPNAADDWSSPAAGGGRPDLPDVLARHYAELVNDSWIGPLNKQAAWMREGFQAFATSDAPDQRVLREAIQQQRLLPIRAPASPGTIAQDLEHLDDLREQRYLASVEAMTLVEYLIRQHGLDIYKRLIADYARTQDLSVSAPNVLGMTLDDLDRQWQAYLKQRYGVGGQAR